MINWYPGHMAKAKKRLKEDLKLVDLVIEMLDARIPISSRNHDLDQLLDQQKRVVVLNKMDLAAKKVTENWKNYFSDENPVVALNSRDGKGIPLLMEMINNLHYKLLKIAEDKGRQSKDVRIMVIGIPNVGKSALINSISGRARTKTGDKPGVTRGKQWIKVNKSIRLLDTPGILWPKLEDEDIGYRLAITGAIDSDRYDNETAAYLLIKYILDINPFIIEENYDLDPGMHPYDLMLEIGRKRGCLMSGGKIDKERVSRLILNDYRNGDFGRLSLESPDQITDLSESEE